jgi:hypothetical protein
MKPKQLTAKQNFLTHTHTKRFSAFLLLGSLLLRSAAGVAGASANREQTGRIAL